MASGDLNKRRVAPVVVEGFQRADPRLLLKSFNPIAEAAVKASLGFDFANRPISISADT